MRYRSIAMPPEHGGWGLLVEPLLVGLLAAPSLAGALVAATVTAVFLARQPLKIALIDRLAGRHVARTNTAAAFAALDLAVATVAIAGAIGRAGWAPVALLACATPLAVVQLVADARNRSRGLVPEVSGTAALAASAGAIGLAAGLSPAPVTALWGLAAARTVPAMVTVRTRVARLHGQPAGPAAAAVAHVAALAALAGTTAAGHLSPLVLPVLAALAVRAAVQLRPGAPALRAQQIGLRELVVGLLSATLLGVLARP